MKIVQRILFLVFPVFLNAQTGTWGTTQLPFPATLLQASSSGDKAFFVGFDTGDLIIYDEPTGTWSFRSLPDLKTYTSICALGSKVYICGDTITQTVPFTVAAGSKMIYVYDVPTDTWSVDFLSTVRRQVKICSLGSKVYFCGGYVNGGGPMGGSTLIGQSTVDVYDTLTHSWSVIHMPNARFGHSAYAQNDKVFIGGGVSQSLLGSGQLVPTDIYHPATNTWTTETLSQVSNFVTFGGIANTLFMCYGKNLMNNTSHANYERYDFGSATWSAPSFPATGDRKSAASGSDRVFIGGNNQYLDVYYAPSDSFYTDSLPLNRNYICFTSVNNKILFAGGTLPNGNPTDHVDIFVDTAATIGIKNDPDPIRMSTFPSPADNRVMVVLGSKSKVAKVQLSDMNGKEMQGFTLSNTDRFDLNTSALANGVYLLKVQTENQAVRQKILIAH